MKFISLNLPTTENKSNDISVCLTSVGKQKAERYELDGPKYTIMSLLQEEGTLTINDLANKASMGANKVRDICKELKKSGYVKRVK